MTYYNDDKVKLLLSQVKTRPSEGLESESVEFKAYRNERALHNSKDLAEELSALANLNGGIVIVGVKDNSDVTGTRWEEQLQGIADVDILKTKERLAGKLKPNVDLSVRSVLFEGTPYVVIEIDKNVESLVSTSSGKTCIREGRSSRPMSPAEIERAVKSLARYDWSSDFPHDYLKVELDSNAIAEAIEDFCARREIQEEISEENYLEAVAATHNGRITRGGLLLLGTKASIRECLGDFEFRFTWKRPNGELVINDVWSGNLWYAIRHADRHFESCNSIHRFHSGDTEFDAPLMDSVAFHEAYLNALVHRDYTVDGMISVTYTGNELRIHSPGAFFGGVTSENIALHEPRHRNKNLARILMSHNLVDRAGMGVLRMGMGALKYGRAFPEFREQSNAVEVRMQAEYLRPGVAVLAISNQSNWGVPELLILNTVYESGVSSVRELERRLQRVEESPWRAIKKAVNEMPQIELCGTRDGIFVRVIQNWKDVLSVGRIFRTSQSSKKYVKLYEYLRTHGQASNADLTELLGHIYSSQTSKFLRGTQFVERKGSGPNARWRILES